MTQPTTKQLRKMGASLHVTIPASIVRQLELSHGDAVFFNPTGDGLRLKFLKFTSMTDMAGVTPAQQNEDAAPCPT
jgi:antitoxin component of MazEF toxin-antitoxin module